MRTGKQWSFDSNPFLGSKELSGLKILTVLLNNWDIKRSNTAVFQVSGENGRLEDWYLFSDLGSTFGRTDHHAALISKRSRWSLKDFQEQPFIDRTANGLLDFHYRGAPPIDMVSLEHARWFAGLASQLSHDQVRQAFKAAGASAADIEGFSSRVIAKIGELGSAVALTEN